MQSKLLLWTAASMLLGGEALEIMRPKVLVYRDSPDVTCEDCPETIARLLESSPLRMDVSFASPKDIHVDKYSLSRVTLFAFPGGPGELLPEYHVYHVQRGHKADDVVQT
jgi:hypothetical protein